MDKTTRSLKPFFALVISLLIFPIIVFGTHCYESKSMCEDIAKLGDKEIDEFPNPVFLDITSQDLDDTWGAARRNGATHEGTDILTDRGVYIVMPTDGVVDRTGVSGFGGKHVFIYIGGGEKLYFAHLDDWADGLSEGDVLRKGDLVGYIGNTGAEYTVPHLHLTIYQDGVPENAYPRMKDEDWSLREQMRYLEDIIDDASNEEREARYAFDRYESLIRKAVKEDVRISRYLEDIIEGKAEDIEDEPVVDSDLEEAQEFELFEENMSIYTDTDEREVKRLQRFFRDVEDADIRVTGDFDEQTKDAVKDFQEKYSKEILDIWGLDRATGYLGVTTRLKMNFLIQSGSNSCPIFTEYNSLTENEEGSEVKETQRLLEDLDLYDGRIDGRFDQEVHESMIKFQEMFDATMLKPWGLTRGTGYKYKTTNKFMNYLRGCDTGVIDLDGKGTFDF